MGCCLASRPHLESEGSGVPTDSALAHAVSGSSIECAEQEQGNEEVLGPGPGQSNNSPSSSGPADEEGETEDEEEHSPGPDQPEDLSSFSGVTIYVCGNGETEKEEPGPGVGLPENLPPGTSIGFATHVDSTEETEHEEGSCSNQDEPEDLPSPSGSATHESKKSETMFQPRTGGRVGLILGEGQSSAKQYPASGITDEDLWNFSVHLLNRFEEFGELVDLQQAIAILEEMVRSTPVSAAQYHPRLVNLGVALRYRFDQLGDLDDLKDAILRQRDAVVLVPHGHPDKHVHLNNLGSALKTRFEHLGELSDLEAAISTLRDAADLTPDGHPRKPARLTNLGNSLLARFQHLGELSDLEDAISRHRNAVDLTASDHPHRAGRLNNLGNSFRARFEHLGKLGDLEDAILATSEAVEATRDGHPHKPGLLNSLGSCFFARFEHIGELTDLESAISRHRDAVNFTRHDHPLMSQFLNCLANSLYTRFNRLGELSDLEVAILTLRDAINRTPHTHHLRTNLLNSLGGCLCVRFQHVRELGDIEDALSRLREAVDLAPHGHPDKPIFLTNLGSCLFVRFELLVVQDDLENAISTLKEAVDLAPHGHPVKPRCLSNLGDSFLARFEHLGQVSDLEDAISTHRDAMDLTTHGHPNKHQHLCYFGKSLVIRFKRLGELRNLEDAILILRDAVDLTPHDHPDKLESLTNLGDALFTRFESLGKPGDLEEAISHYSHAASTAFGSTRLRSLVSRKWISCASLARHHSLLQAYSVFIGLLPQLAWIAISTPRRYIALLSNTDVVREAAAAALDAGLPQTAVEWLEQGRSVIWGELFQLHGSYEELSSAYPDHARRLRELSTALEHAGVTRERFLPSWSEQTQGGAHRVIDFLRSESDNHHMLAIYRDKLLQEIRTFPGFERFLLHKEFSQLRAAAHSGPVVILNAAESRCDALIIVADVDQVIHVPLPTFTSKRSVDLKGILKFLLAQGRVVPFDDREGTIAPRGGTSWKSLLSPLWKCVVKPVLDTLAFSVRNIKSAEFTADPLTYALEQTPGALSRIFWCPTGPFMFLPIHAAGLYGPEYSQPGHKVFDFVVSSYIPTLSALLRLPDPALVPSDDVRLLFVRQPLSDGLSRLPGVTTELEHVREVIKNSPLAHTTLLESNSGTVEEVLELMEEANWVHFACHGIQANQDSGLCLADGRRLRLRDMTASSRPYGGLAFLSACQTATGEVGLPDEAVHIAGGMLFAGYGGVIGTMWSICDRLAPDVARDVYEHLFRGGGARPDYREAAQALHEAVGHLRDGNASFNEWLPFIHVGL